MKFSWGQGITVTMIAFAAMMTTFMYRAYHAQEELVAENYYEQEIRYQEQIDKLDNAARLGSAVEINVIAEELVISFPSALTGVITGELYLQRPSDARFDERIPFSVKDGELRISMADRIKGMYRAQLDWSFDGADHLTVERIYVE